MQILQALYGLLTSVGVTLSLACLVMAGLKLREEGGINFHAGGGFFKWLLWAVIFLTLPGIQIWLQSEGVQTTTLTATTAPYTSTLQHVLSDFVINYLVGRIVPILAAMLLFKGLLDLTEGRHPMPSIVTALFLLSVQGTYTLMQTWAAGAGTYAVTDVLWSMCSYLFTTISPIVGALCIVGAIFNYIRDREWANLVFGGIGFLTIWGLWSLLQSFAGVSVS
jgi:hypothetical protein